jgi:hypothetical protein
METAFVVYGALEFGCGGAGARGRAKVYCRAFADRGGSTRVSGGDFFDEVFFERRLRLKLLAVWTRRNGEVLCALVFEEDRFGKEAVRLRSIFS